MLHNVLVRQLPMVGRDRIVAALTATGIAPDRRPQTLSVDDWLALSAALGPIDTRAGRCPEPDAVSLETTASAKVNLALAVTGRRADGYHELRSVFLRLGSATRCS